MKKSTNFARGAIFIRIIPPYVNFLVPSEHVPLCTISSLNLNHFPGIVEQCDAWLYSVLKTLTSLVPEARGPPHGRTANREFDVLR